MGNLSTPTSSIPRYRIINAARVQTLEDLEWLSEQLPGWVFRGQSDSSWRLQPLLERIERGLRSLKDIEAGELAEFKKRWEVRGGPVPSPEDHLNWLALLRHQGGLTRLLDFTTSVRVALYFATCEPSPGRPAIWAVNAFAFARLLSLELAKPQRAQFAFDDPVQGWPVFNRIYPHRMRGFAVAVFFPRGDNERMNAQRGVFLASLNMDYTLEQNLYGMFDWDPEDVFGKGPSGVYLTVRKPSTLRALQRLPVIKLELDLGDPSRVHQYVAENGVSRSVLFPDLVG